MDPPLILIIVLTAAFATTALEERFLGERSMLVASLEYLLLGVIVGPLALGLLEGDSLDSLSPLLAVVTGFAGFLVGLPLSIREVRAYPRGTLRFALVGGTVISGLIMAAAAAVFTTVPIAALADTPTDVVIVAAAVLGLGAAITSVDSVRAGVRAARADGPVSRLLPGAADIIRVLAIVGFGLVLAAQRADTLGDAGAALLWAAIAMGAGVALGIIFVVFVGDEQDEKKLFVATIGVVALASGVASALSFSPLFLNLVAGATIANLSPRSGALLAASMRLRRPIFAVLLILAGASWTPIPLALWLIPVGFVAVRVLALRIGARVALVTTLRDVDNQTPGLGNALLSQGALVAAVAVDYYTVVPHTVIAGVVLSTLLLSAVLNEIWFGAALRTTLQNVGESGRLPPTTKPAPAETPSAGDEAAREAQA